MGEVRNWSVYMIRCSNGALYTGITTDVIRRLSQHATGTGARFFNRSRVPREIVFLEPGHSQRSAAQREAAIKQLRRREKLLFLKQQGLGRLCWLEPDNAAVAQRRERVPVEK